MPLSATFIADFASFSQACDDADVKLKTFEQGAGKVETSLNRMANSLSGTKLIQDATLAAEAVDRVGGVSTLTEKQLARLSAQATEAVAKMKALGIDVPPGIRKIADEATAAGKAHEGMLGTVKDLAAGFTAMFVARAAWNFVSTTAEEASALKNLGQQTHINVEELQLLAGGMTEFGVDADTLGKGLYTLSRKIAGGDESVARGLALMGVSLKDVDGLQGKELFLKIESGLATLQGGLRDTAASDIFGSRLGMAMAGASEGIEGALASYRSLNIVASTESVDALAKYDDAIKRVEKSLGSMATNLLGPVAQGANAFIETSQKAGFWAAIWARTEDAALELMGRKKTAFDELAAKYGVVTEATTKSATATAAETAAREASTAATTAQGQASQFMAVLEANAAKSLSASQLDNLAHLKEIGQLTAANASAIGVNTAEFAKYTAEMEAAKKVAADLKKIQDDAARLEAKNIEQTTKLWEEYYLLRAVHGGTANDIAIAQIDRWAADLTANLVRAGGATKEFYAGLAAVSAEKMASVGIDWNYMRDHSLATLQEIAANHRATYDAMMADSGNFTRETLQAQLEKTREAEVAARLMGRTYVTAFDEASASAAKATEEMRALAEEAAKANRAMGSTVQYDLTTNFGRAQVEQMNPGVSRYLTQGYSLEQAMQLLMAERYHFTANVGAPDNPRPPSGTYPGFAAGVQNFTGGPAIVGERGPELLNLPRGSSVIPLGGGGSVTLNMAAGAVQLQYPIMRDRQSMDQIGQVVGEAIVQRLTAQGWRPPLSVRR